MHILAKQFRLFSLVCILLSGCQKETSQVIEESASNYATIPTLTRDDLINLNDNQWDELERRCLGHKYDSNTCELMSDSSVQSEHETMSDFNKLAKKAQRALEDLNAEKSY